MEIYVPTSSKELSQRKLEEYSKAEKILNAGRRNPIWFTEEVFGVKLIDYQKWCFMKSWTRKYCLWLCSRRTGKTTLAAVFLPTKMLLIPSYKVYISTNSAQQSIEVFKMIEDIALRRVPSFSTCTDIFSMELEKSANSETGFLHNPSGHSFRLFNNSELMTLSTNINALRGKGGSVFYDETAWQTSEQMAATEHFADTDASFSLGTDNSQHIDPPKVPLQLIYASSAGDVEYPFYSKYKMFSKKMILGDKDYFACDLNANTVLKYSTVDGEKIKPHLTEEAVQKAIEDDPEKAERELFNRFRKGSGQNAIIKMDTIIRNSVVRPPLLYNDTGKKKFLFFYDPARNFDGSILGIFELVNDATIGYKLKLVNMVSMIDNDTKAKTPLPMPEQLKIIKNLLIKYNGERSAEWENVEFYIDAGAGGGGISAVADALMEDWKDDCGQMHKGIIDPVHKQYETSRKKYTHAAPIVHLIDPKAYKKIMFDSLEKMTKLDLIEFPEYDGRDYLLLQDSDGEVTEYKLSCEEQMALVQCNLAINELIYITRYETPNGGIYYELARDKKNKMHDDRAYVIAMAGYALALMRRTDLTEIKQDSFNLKEYVSSLSKLNRKPTTYR